MQPWMSGNKRSCVHAARVKWPLLLSVTLLAAGCGSTSITTPLPELKPVSSPSMNPQERKQAVEALNQKRATHEQDAVEEIERSR